MKRTSSAIPSQVLLHRYHPYIRLHFASLAPRSSSIVAEASSNRLITDYNKRQHIQNYSTMPFPVPYTRVNPNIVRPGDSIKEEIILTSQEQQIRDLVVEYCDYYNKTNNISGEEGTQSSEPLIARITGGWVRDKLLGRQSHDIDIAVNLITGIEFAEGINKFIQDRQTENSDNSNNKSTTTNEKTQETEKKASTNLEKEPPKKTSNIYKIERNPEKSKHLETATTKLFGLDVDVVNLRSEKYASDSRIPIMEFGTAEEDAFRRDATINALFYNLQESKVEDFTGHGLEDLKAGIIRTPLDPLETFNDDPLRVLRLIRFASTFGFEVEKNTLDAMSDSEVKESLMLKISRERVGVELTKALISTRPDVCLGLIHHLGLFHAIFYFAKEFWSSPDLQLPESNITQSLEATELVLKNAHPYLTSLFHASPSEEHVIDEQDQKSKKQTTALPKVGNALDIYELNRLHYWLSVSLNVYEGILTKPEKKKQPQSKKKKSPTPPPPTESSSSSSSSNQPIDILQTPVNSFASFKIIRDGIKLSSNDATAISSMQKIHLTGQLSYFVDDADGQLSNHRNASDMDRKTLGLLVRACGENWRLVFLYCLFKDVVSTLAKETKQEENGQKEEELVMPIFEYYNTLVTRVVEDNHGLQDAWKLKPILNGNQVLKLFETKKGGNWLMNALNDLIELQLQDPQVATETAEKYLLEKRSKYFP